ncbi:MAG: methyltransferase domain-containing protein [Myxococcales bacterium]|nr:methyltransferase domain-containing protein [Myxococcales bacterium]
MSQSQTPRHQPLIDRFNERRMGAAQRWRTAAHHAGYLLAYLRPGMDLLDVGCGPGTITWGLAEHVAPGRTVGLDLRVRPRREDVATLGPAPDFVVGSVYSLPFDDDRFDAAHAHALFQHLDRPLDALRELRRVLRPGAVIGLADWDRAGTLLHPAPPELTRSLEWLSELRRMDGGDPTAGRRLAELMQQAGFDEPAMHVVADGFGSGPAAARTAEGFARTLEEPAVVARLVDGGVAAADELQDLPARWRAWGGQPGAIFVALWFCAVAFR